MTKFLNGPAAEKTLMLRRMPSPTFLRVTINAVGEIDALDMPEDDPMEDETCHAYKVAERRGGMHLQKRGGGGGFFPITDYAFIEQQPPQETMRTHAAWVEWCEMQPEARA